MRVALVQLESTKDIDRNLSTSRRLGEQAAQAGARWLLFPENAPFMAPDREKPAIAEDLGGSLVGAYRELARDLGCWITVGSFPERSPDAERTFNTQVLLDPEGQTAAVYRKLHLFDVDVEGSRFRESEDVVPGDAIVTADLPVAPDESRRIGLSICYDLRFPELFRALVEQGAEMLTVPSAFTLATGRDHWHPLLQARAIENQCYVLAPNQWGHHYGNRYCYGHSAIYDPWGRMIACASDRETIVVADLDFEYLDTVRQRIPCLSHQRLPLG